MSGLAIDPHRRLLVVHHDEGTRASLREGLEANGYGVTAVGSVTAAAQIAGPESAIDLVVIDAGRHESGYTLLCQIRGGMLDGVSPHVGVITTSRHARPTEVLRALELGADDHLTMPYSLAELRARIAAILRRLASPTHEIQRVGALSIDRSRRLVTVCGDEVRLTNNEYALLIALANEPTRVYSRDELLREVWGIRDGGNTRRLDVLAARLRAKLANSPDRFIANVWGVGFRLAKVRENGAADGGSSAQQTASGGLLDHSPQAGVKR